MKKKFSREFKIGFFGIAMMGCLYWGVNFLKGTDIFSSTTKYYAVYDQVNGLQPSAAIVIKGFKVGTIKTMNYDPNHSENIVLEFAIKSKYKIPKNSTARIFSDGIMSGKSIEIQLGNSHEQLHENDTLFLMADKDFLEVAGSEFEFIKQRFNTIANSITVTLDNLNMVITENQASVKTTLSNTAAISTSLNDVITHEKSSIQDIMSNLNSLSLTLKNKSGQIDNIINNVENFSDSLSKSQIPTMIAELSMTLNKLNSTLETVNNGEGTVGKFINDKALYEELVATSSNLSALLEDIKANPKRYINVSVFGGKNK